MATNPQPSRGPRTSPEAEGHKPHSRSTWVLGIGGLVLLWAWLRQAFGGRTLIKGPKELASSRPAEANSEPIKDHERRDANAKWIFGLILFLLVFGLSLHGILAGFLSALMRHAPPTDQWRPGIKAQRRDSPPPGLPRLQVSPPLDLQRFRAQEEEQLKSYGWIDRKAGVVRLPIDRAIDLVLQEGLPARSGTNENTGGPSSYQLIQQRGEQREGK